VGGPNQLGGLGRRGERDFALTQAVIGRVAARTKKKKKGESDALGPGVRREKARGHKTQTVKEE